MSTATLNGNAVLSCRVNLPKWGAWYADVEIGGADALTGAATLVLGDLTLVGTILSGGVWQSRARYRIVGGRGGWGKTIKGASYSNDAGLPYAKLLADAALACKETLGVAPVGVAGASYVRPEGRAALVLEQLFPAGWYVDETGVTQIGARLPSVYLGKAVRFERDIACGMVSLAAEDVASLLPGCVVDDITAIDVEHTLENDKLRTTVWGEGEGAKAGSIADSMRGIVGTLTARHRFFAPWEYRVVTRSGERYALQPVRVSSGMPTLQNVRVRGGVAGAREHLTLGSLVLVSFVDGLPSRPVITGFDDPESPGFIPAELALAGTVVRLGTLAGNDPIVRQTDLQTAIDTVRTWLNTHVHATAGTGAPVAPTVLLSPVTATGSAIVKGA